MFMCVSVGHAATLLVPSVSYPTLMSAIAAARNGDVIKLVDDNTTYTMNSVDINFDLEITSESENPGDYVIDGYDIQTSYMFRTSGDLTLTGVTFQHFKCLIAVVDSYGGNSTLSVEHCVFTENVCGTGGAIYVGDNTASISYSSFFNNESEFGGAAISLNEAKIDVSYCSFQENRALGDFGKGGAIYSIESEVNMYSCTFKDNYSTLSGGAVYSENDIMDVTQTINKCYFKLNDSEGTGGAMHLFGGVIDIDSTNFANNTSLSSGGAIFFEVGAFSVDSCSFVNGTSGLHGGAMLIQYLGGAVTREVEGYHVDNCIFKHNSALHGGAIYDYANVVDEYGLLIANSVFTENFTDVVNNSHGGALLFNHVKAFIVNCLFTLNKCGDGQQGSAVASISPNSPSPYVVTIEGSTFSKNGDDELSSGSTIYVNDSVLHGYNLDIVGNYDLCPLAFNTDYSYAFSNVNVFNSDWSTCSPNNLVCTNALSTDPHFLNPDGVTPDFRVKWDSDMYDAGCVIENEYVETDFDLTPPDVGWSPKYPVVEISGNVTLAERGWYKTTGNTIISGVDAQIPEGTTILNDFGGTVLMRDTNPVNDYNITVGDQNGARTSLSGPSYCFGSPQNGQGDLAFVSFDGVLFSLLPDPIETSLWFEYCVVNINGENGNVKFYNYNNSETYFDETCSGRYENFNFAAPIDENGILHGMRSIFMYYSDIDINNIQFDIIPFPFSGKVFQYGTVPGEEVTHVISNCTFDCTDNQNETYPLFIAYSTANLHHNTFNNIDMNSIYLSEATLNMRNGAYNVFTKPSPNNYGEFPMIDGLDGECSLWCGNNTFIDEYLINGDLFINVDAIDSWGHNFWGQSCDDAWDPEDFLPEGVDSSPWLEDCPDPNVGFIPCDDQDEETVLFGLGQEANEIANYQSAQAYWSQMMQEFPESKYCNDAVSMLKAIGLLTEYGEENYSSIRSCLESAAVASDSVDTLLSVFQVCSAWCVEGRHGDREASVALLDSLYEEKEGDKDMETLINTALAEIDSYPPQGQNSSMNIMHQIAQMVRRQEKVRALQSAMVPELDSRSIAGPETAVTTLPNHFGITSCHPNPFNPTTMIEVNVNDSTPLLLEVYNIIGQRVRILQDGQSSTGVNRFFFDGDGLSSGLYFVRAQQGSRVDVSKVMLVR